MEMLQSNIYYYVRMKGYIVSTQEISCVYTRDSCVYTRDCLTVLCVAWQRSFACLTVFALCDNGVLLVWLSLLCFCGLSWDHPGPCWIDFEQVKKRQQNSETCWTSQPKIDQVHRDLFFLHLWTLKTNNAYLLENIHFCVFLRKLII